MTKPTTEEKIIVDLDGNIKKATDAFFTDPSVFLAFSNKKSRF
jgi:hypothetical protein